MIKKENIYCKIKIANEFSKYFANIGRTIAGKIFPVIQAFDSYIRKTDSQTIENQFSINKISISFYFENMKL